MKLYIYRFTDTGLMLHSYTVKSLQPQYRAEQSKADTQIHVSATMQLQYRFSATSIQLQSLRDTEPQSYR